MSVSFVCPHCGKGATFDPGKGDVCPHCRQPIPEALAAELNRNHVPKRPFVISMQMVVGYILGFFMLIGVLGIFAEGAGGHYTFLGERLTHIQFIVFGLFTRLPSAVLLLLSSEAIRKEMPEGRMLIFLAVFAYFISSAVKLFVHDTRLDIILEPELQRTAAQLSLFVSFIVVLLAYWYLYRNRRISGYYDALEARRAEAAQA